MSDIEDRNRERRDREIERSGNTKIAARFTTKVVGVSFQSAFPDNILALSDAAQEAHRVGEPLSVVLVRNPANQYDANACEVHVPALGGDWGMIGHLTRPIAARLAPELDAGVRWHAEVEAVLIHPDNPDNPGISITCSRIAGKEEEQ